MQTGSTYSAGALPLGGALSSFSVDSLASPPGAAEILMARHPGLRVAGTHHGFAEETDSEPIEAINRSGASILLIGMGSPQAGALDWQAS